MKLHGNAALSLKKRRLLVSRVVEEGWSLAKAAEAAEVSDRTAGVWVRPVQGRGRGRPVRSFLGAHACAQPHRGAAHQVIACPAAPAHDRL